MLQSPTHAVIGSRDLRHTCDLLRRFGFDRRSDFEVPASAAWELYHLDGPLAAADLGVEGATAGGIRVVTTPHGPLESGAYDSGPVAVDLYTRSIERSLEIAAEEGLEIGELVKYDIGTLSLLEAEVTDREGLRLVFIEIDPRRPSVLDHALERLHSEVHSIVFAVPSAERAVGFWKDVAGLEVLVDAPIRGPVISRLMGLPRPDVPIHFALLCDGEASPARFEVIEFLEDEGSPTPTLPLRAGLHAAAFRVADLAAARRNLVGCTFGSEVELAGHTVVSAETPDGLRFELWG